MTKTTLSLLLAAALAVPGFALAAPSVSADRGAHLARAPMASEARAGEGARRGRRGHDPERRIARMTAELELADTQVRAVREVMQAARAEREALRALPRSPELREQQRAIMERAARGRERGVERGERGARGTERGRAGGIDPRGV